MRAPLIPANDKERLQALLEYRVLDSAPESSYDEVVRLASIICQTPVALVSLVDEHRQWFKAKKGLEVSEMPRELSFCGHAIHQEDVFEIRNALEDERFHDNPLVAGEANIRFYAGAPLLTPAGFAIGTLCVVDQQPQALTDEQKEALASLAKVVVRELESRKALKESNDKMVEIQKLTKVIEEQRGQMVQLEKLKALGEVAGGIAHEINTPLSVIQSHAGAVVRKLQSNTAEGDEVLIEKMHKIQDTVNRIGHITKGMLLFSRQGTLDDVAVHSVQSVIKVSSALLRGKISSLGISFHVDEITDFSVKCSQQKAVQILTNLLVNAQDALKTSAKKQIHITLVPSAENGCGEIRISDTGPGVPEEIRTKIMQPFFTTKPAGEGTGLGLSISAALAKAQGGMLYLDTSSEMTTFVLRLPLAL